MQSEHPPMTPNTPAQTPLRTHPVLVVLDPEQPNTTLENVFQHADLVDRDLHFLLVYPTKEYEARRRARIEAGITTPFAISHLEAEARQRALHLGHEWHGGTNGTVTAMGRVGRLRDRVGEIVEENGYEEIYLDPTPQSSWQRLRGRIDAASSVVGSLPEVTFLAVDSRD